LAAPSLGDPNFEATVVLLGMHDEQGSLGWVVNGPAISAASTIIRATDLVDPDDPLPAVFDRPARRGGPVSPETLWILYRSDGDAPVLDGSIRIGQDIAVTATAEALRTIIAGDGPADIVVLVGYAGWGPGQLAREMSLGAWLPTAAQAELLFGGAPETLWQRGYAAAIGTVPAAFVSTTRGSA
jgi:putative transcriptional regulator